MSGIDTIRQKLVALSPLLDADTQEQLGELIRLAELGQAVMQALPQAKAAATTTAAPRGATASAPKATVSPSKKRAKKSAKAGGRIANRAEGGTLRDHVLGVLSRAHEPMTLKEITAAVMQSGYSTRSPDPSKVVAAFLSSGHPSVERVEKGVYRMKK